MSDETIFSEVSEELRRDRMHKAWRRYGPYLIGAAVLVVLVVAANEGWSWFQSGNASRSSDQFYAALDVENGGDLAAAQKALDQVIAQGSGQYPLLAKFKQASLLARQGKNDAALAAYDALASGQGNQRLRELALLLGASVLVDKGDVPGVKSRVQGLLAADNPLRNSARETIGLAQYKAGDLNGARDSFEAVANDANSTSEARSRMQIYIAQLVSQGASPPGGNAAASPASATPAAPAANDNAAPATPAAATGAAAPTDNSAPAGVESNQPSVPDAALDMATPAPAASPAPDASQPMLQSGAGLAAPGADAPATSAPATPAAAPPATTGTSATPAAPAAGTPAPASGTTGH